MNGETITLTQRGQQQLMVLNALERGELLVGEAGVLLECSVRQTQRLRAGYRERGAAALVHGNRGRRSPRRVADSIRTQVVDDATGASVPPSARRKTPRATSGSCEI
ncbi:MAG: hypothetical protein HY316_03975 [Acidobacteria bacterium]|nr:hypothetical protein [Acidobacteriota bacterium]